MVNKKKNFFRTSIQKERERERERDEEYNM